MGQIINVGVGLLTLKVWAIYLDPTQLGLMALIISSSSILCGIIIEPFVRATFVRFAVYEETGKGEEFRSVCWDIVYKKIIVFGPSIIITGLLLSYFINLSWQTPVIVAGLFAVDAKRYFEQMLFSARRRQEIVVMISVGDVCLRLLFLYIFLWMYGSSAYVAATGNLAGAVTLLLILWFNTHSVSCICLKGINKDTRENIKNEINLLAKPLIPSNILANISEMGSRYLIAAMLGLNQAGIFVAIYGIVKRPFGMLSDIGHTAITPAYTEAIASKDNQLAKFIKFAWFWGIAFFSLMGVILFYVLKEFIVAILLSENYVIAGDYLVEMAVAVSIINLSIVLNGVVMAHGCSKMVLNGNLIAALASITFMIALIPIYELNGAIWGIGIAYVIQFIYLVYKASSKKF